MYHSASLAIFSPGGSSTHQGGRSCDAIITLVAAKKNVSIQAIKHASRCRANEARARQLAMYLCHVMLGQSLLEVGQAFGRDRTTVSYACGLIEDLRENPEFDQEVEGFEALIDAMKEAQHD